MASIMWRVDWILDKEFKKQAKKFVKDVAKDIQQAYDDSLEEWWKGFVKWSKNSYAKYSFDFLRKASSGYASAKDNLPVDTFDDETAFQSGIDLNPFRMNAELVSRWGDRRHAPFSDLEAFMLTYKEGVYGYNRDIVKRCWYKSSRANEALEMYKIKYHMKKSATRSMVIQNIIHSGVVPPKAKKTPNEIMQKKYNKIVSKRNLDKKIAPYLKEISQDILKIADK